MRCLRIAACVLLTPATFADAGVHSFTSTGPYGGWTQIVGAPSSAGHAIAGRGGGLYLTTDGGHTWASTGPYAGAGAFALAFGPSDSKRIYMLGAYLYRSDNSGATWAKGGVVPIPYFQYGGGIATVSRLVVSPHAGDDLYFADGEIAYSADGGDTWTVSRPPGANEYVYDVAVDPSVPDTIHAATGNRGFATGIARGTTWIDGAGLPADYAGVRLAVADDRLYLVLARRNGAPAVRYEYDHYAVYTSVDRGRTWKPTAFSLAGANAWTEMDIVPVPKRPGGVLLRAGAELYGSADHGATWSAVTLPDGGQARAIGADADGVYVSIAGYGIRRSTDGGATWQRARGGLPPAPTSHAQSMGTTLLATTPSGYRSLPAELLRRSDGRNEWTVSLQNPSAVLSSFSIGVSSFLGILAGPYSFSGFVADPVYGSVLAFANGALLRSYDQGRTWMTVEGSSFSAGGPYFAAARGAATIYSCGAGGPVGSGATWGNGGFGVSVNGGTTWTPLSTSTGYFGCTGIAVAAESPNFAYVSLNPSIGSGILATQDLGRTWHVVPGTAGVSSPIAADPGNARRIFAVTGYPPTSIVAIDTQTGASAQVGDALPASISALTLDASTSPPTAYVATVDAVYTRPAVAGAGPWTKLAGSDRLAATELALAPAPRSPERPTLIAASSSGVHEYTFDPADTLMPVYRLFNAQTRGHLFTASAAERKSVLANLPQFHDEGIAFYALRGPAEFAVPVWRFYRPSLGTHAYPMSNAELDALRASGDAIDEGIAFHAPYAGSGEPGALAVYRFVNATTGDEVFTTDDDEREYIRESLPQHEYRGVVFIAYPPAAGR